MARGLAHVATLAALLLASCSSIDVKTEKTPGMNVSQYQTFKWATKEDVEKIAKANPEGEQRLGNYAASRQVVENKTLDEVVRTKTDSLLADDGLRSVPPQDPADLLVAYFAFTGHKTITSNMAVGTTVAPYGGMYGAPYGVASVPVTHTYREGSLVVVLFDGKTLRSVWRGAATSPLEDNPKDTKKNVDKALNDMFKDLRKTA